jgi:SAM-dependent methyltransferase
MNSDSDWRYWGSKDPLFAVASWKGKQITSATPWTTNEFLKLGESDMTDVLLHWRQYGLISGRCVEVGCGAGRMTAPLLSAFSSVLGLDVSPEQLEKAKSHLSNNLNRVTFQVVEGPSIPAPNGSASGVFSCHVFQHFSDFSGIAAYITEAFRVLAPGGTICFHIPVPGAHLNSSQRPYLRWLRNCYAKLARVIGSRLAWEYHRYDAKKILTLLREVGFESIELRIFPMRSNGDFHSYFFATKPLSVSA